MAWTAPMTAVANSAFTAAQFNTHVRDNLNETGPAKATTTDRLIVTTGPQQIGERVIPRPVRSISTADLFAFTNTTFLDGNTQLIPVVGVVFRADVSGMAAIIVGGLIGTNVAENAAYLSFELREGDIVGAGSNVLGAHGERGIATSEVVVTDQFGRIGASFVWLQEGLTPDTDYNVRCMHAMSPAGHGSIHSRSIIAWPII